MNLELLQDWLEGEGYGDAGKDSFVHYMPDHVETGFLLVNPLFNMEINPSMPNERRSKFQLTIRDTNHEDGFKKAWALHKALSWQDKRVNLSDEVFVHFLFPRHDPLVFPFSKGDNIELSIMFDAAYVLCN